MATVNVTGLPARTNWTGLTRLNGFPFLVIFLSLCYTRATYTYVSAVFATATWLGGWVVGCLSVTRRYCIKTAKPILKLFRPFGSPIILVFVCWHRYPIPMGTPSPGTLNSWGWEKMAFFDQNRRLSRKRCEIGRWLLWNVNRKSWVPGYEDIYEQERPA